MSVSRGNVRNKRSRPSLYHWLIATLSRTSGGGEKLLPLIVPSLCVAERRGGVGVGGAGVFYESLGTHVHFSNKL